jgi:thiol-disulfide isomerase/thioredoxin
VRAFLLSLLCLTAACERAPEQQAAPRPARQASAEPEGRLIRSYAGTRAPAAEFQDADGNPVSLAAFRGRPLLVNLWATWCAPCVAEMPTLEALAAQDGPAQVIAISQDLDGRDKVHAFFEKHQLEALQPYLDNELNLMGALKVESLPTTILYDAEGREVWRIVGMEDWTGERAVGLLNTAAGAS